ncbi:hypothetical protein BDQ17DRAFT_1428632 [Cyathus striatus]|nr:hypothetical protein BDQ17DRAFT_1428632 [Cyathus striatus]
MLHLVFFTLLPGLVSAAVYDLVLNSTADSFSTDRPTEDSIPFSSSDSTPNGSQKYVDAETAFGILPLVDLDYSEAHHMIIKMDNTTNIPQSAFGSRNSVKIVTQAAYSLGSVWIIDLFHVPYGCGVRPAVWSMAPTQVGGEWPRGGCIGTFEALNKEISSQMMLYTEGKCNASSSNSNQNQASIVNTTDCSGSEGCITTNAGFPSFGPEFNSAGGGVYITEFAFNGISIWFFPRNNIPPNWAPSICGLEDFTQVFLPQSLAIEIALCDDLSNARYNQTCSPGNCQKETAFGNGSNFSEAYFEIGSVQVFNQTNVTSSNTSTNNGTPTGSSGSTTDAVKGSDGSKPKVMTIGIIMGVICGFFTCSPLRPSLSKIPRKQ